MRLVGGKAAGTMRNPGWGDLGASPCLGNLTPERREPARVEPPDFSDSYFSKYWSWLRSGVGVWPHPAMAGTSSVLCVCVYLVSVYI